MERSAELIAEVFSSMLDELQTLNQESKFLLDIPTSPNLQGLLRLACIKALVEELQRGDAEDDFYYEVSPTRQRVLDYKQYQYVIRAVSSKTRLLSDLNTYFTIGIPDELPKIDEDSPQEVVDAVNEQVKAELDLIHERASIIGENLLLDIIDVQMKIIHYCNRNTVPLDATHIWIDMIIDILSYRLATAISILQDTIEDDLGMVVGKLRSIKVGDTNTEWFASNYQTSGMANAYKSRPELDLDGFILKYEQSLNAFRVLRV